MTDDIKEEVAQALGKYKLGHCPPDVTEAICADLKSDCCLCHAKYIQSLYTARIEQAKAEERERFFSLMCGDMSALDDEFLAWQQRKIEEGK